MVVNNYSTEILRIIIGFHEVDMVDIFVFAISVSYYDVGVLLAV